MDVKSLLANGARLTDEALEALLPGPETLPHSIHRAMRHSTFAGGKRLRPVLCIEAARMVAGGLPEGIANLGAAIEMLHTYSLIHDDLPALDNDDLRRGKPTCHVVFGEDIAILAGDALQALAFQTLAGLPAAPAAIVGILREVAVAVGTGVGSVGDIQTPLAPGMIGGQVMDLESEGEKPTADLVEAIHRAKTGALITVSIVAGGLYGLPSARLFDDSNIDSFRMTPERREKLHQALQKPIEENIAAIMEAAQSAAGNTAERIAALRTFGQKAGLAFQIVDDVLDVTESSEALGKTAGKDAATDKATWPAVYGVERSRKDAAELIADAFQALDPFGPAAAPLKAIAQYLVDRKN